MIVVLLLAAAARAAEPVFVDVTATVTPGLPQVGYSAVAWADFDNDGRQDFLLAGQLWRNTGTGFSNVTAAVELPGGYTRAVDWGDYDNDGRLDLLFAGQIWRNTASGFTNVTATLAPGLPGADAVAWGDFDNDGRLDFLLTGGFVSQVWRNTGAGFTNVTATVAADLPGISGGAVAWGDYDNDGRLDFLLTGGIPRRTDLDDDYPYYTPIAQLWRNTGSGFENVTPTAAPGLAGVYWSSVGWADYDNDGRLDFVLMGAMRYGATSQLWRNTGSGFENVTATVAPGLPAMVQGSVDWGDYDNDGWVDLLMPGQVWRNTGSIFTNVMAGVAPTLPRLFHSAATWGDYDDDGRLDMLVIGATSYYCDGCDPPGKISRIYRNNSPATNAPPLVVTAVPSSATPTSAMLNGAINPRRTVTIGWFIWGDGTNYGQVTAAQAIGNGDSVSTFLQEIHGLSTGVTYYYRAVGSNEQGQVVLGVEQRFVLAAPGVASTPPREPATMTADVNPNNLPAYGWFEWGTTPGYGQVTPIQFLGGGFDATLSQDLSGLEVGATYYYRAVVSNGVGVVYGAAQNLVAAEPIVRCPLGFLWPDTRTHGYGWTENSVHFWIGCDWTAINTNSWIYINSDTNGPAGYGGFWYYVAPNYDFEPRSGNITIGGHNVSIAQGAAPPIIITQPTSQTVVGGGTATFNVSILQTNPVTYQWYRHGVPLVPLTDGNGISGATSSNLVLTGVQLSQAGYYQVMVSHSNGTKFSLKAKLTVACGGGFSLSASNASHDFHSTTGSVTLNSAATECRWSIVNTNPWVTILSSINNRGNATVLYSLEENPTPMRRSGNITIADQIFTITQSGGGTTNAAISLAEATDSEGYLLWKTIGTPAWFGQNSMSLDGVDAAQSGAISNDTAVTAQSILMGPGTLSFWWKVSSETNKDTLKFFVNGLQQARISGEVDWQYMTYTFPSGTYTSKWTYAKNETIAKGQDRGWLDQVRWFVGPHCPVTLSHTNVTINSFWEGGHVSVAAPPGCKWGALNTTPWLSVEVEGGDGDGYVRFTPVRANDTPEPRAAVILIAGQPFTITQLGSPTTPCTYTISPPSRAHGFGSEAGVFSVAAPPGCYSNIQNTNSWVTILASGYGGSFHVTYSVSENSTTSPRSGNLWIGGQIFAITQSSPADPYPITLPQALDTTATLLTWSNAGTIPWVGQAAVSHDGMDAAMCAPAGAQDVSGRLQTSLYGPGVLSFWWKVSSETNNDTLGLYVNDVAQAVISGEVNWEQRNLTLPPGPQTLEWRYSKDSVNSAGQDRAWVDQVEYLPLTDPTCSILFSPNSRIHTYGAVESTVTVITASNCNWQVSNTNTWISILSPLNGTGNGSVQYFVEANPTVLARSGTINIGGQNFLITQTGIPDSCAVAIWPFYRFHRPGAATGVVTVAIRSGCEWTVAKDNTWPDNAWITILSSHTNAGSGEVIYSVAPNLTGSDRPGGLLIAGQSFYIHQWAEPSTNTNTNPTLSEALDTTGTPLEWRTDWPTPWVAQTLVSHDGMDAAQCAGPGDGTNGRLEMSVYGPGTLTYWWKISSDAGYDTLGLYTNGVTMAAIAGEVDWELRNIRLPPGYHWLQWRYSNSRISAGRAWLDQVQYVPDPGCIISLSSSRGVYGHDIWHSAVTVATQPGCEWSIVNTNSWITISPGLNRSGPDNVQFALMENPNPYTRSGNLTIGGQQFLVMQAGAPGTAPRVEFMSRTESGVTVFMEGEPWKAYILEYSEDLTHWIPLSTNGVTSIITDRTAGNAPRRFYRTVEIP